jgi:DNA-binding NarL/FixJ family response regulator
MKRRVSRLLMMNTIKVAIAEDHRIFRKGIILSMQPYPQIQFIIEAGNGKELIDQLPGAVLPQVILMDLRMPVMDGIETTKYMASHYPDIYIICLTMFDDKRFVDHMMESGASGYLLKNAEPLEINNAIVEVVAKGHSVSILPGGILLNKTKLVAKTGG